MKTAVMLAALCLSASLSAAPANQPDQPQSQCIDTTMIRSSKALDDKTIVFRMRNGHYWVNNLPAACPRLKFNDAFSYRLTGTRLCDIDLITVIEPPFASQGPTCALGKFEKYTPPAKDAAKTTS
jgi:hypothetical protein